MGIPRPKSKQILRKKQSHIIAYYIYFFDSEDLTIFTINFRQPTTERSGTIASTTTTEALKGSFYDPKNDLIVSYKSKPNGGVSVFYTVPKANNRNFIDR